MIKRYFPGLNTLRLYAAVSVVVHHFTAPAVWFGDASAENYYFRAGFMEGRDAVTLFFVLSGFLIITLLLEERERTGTISALNFYKRRAFRILPLYYGTLIAGAVLIALTYPQLSPFGQADASRLDVWLALIFFVFNWLAVDAIPLAHFWTLNVEEQFYAAIPQLMKRAKNILALFVAATIIKLLIEFAALVLFALTNIHIFAQIFFVLFNARFESMAIGGIGAYLLHRQHRLLWVIFHPITQIAAGIGFLAAAWFGSIPTIPYDLATSVIYMLLVVNTAAAPRFWLRIDHPVLHKLGDTSYAIYMFHPLIIHAMYAAGVRGLVFQIGAVILTLIAAYLSRIYVEAPFLKLRDRLTVR